MIEGLTYCPACENRRIKALLHKGERICAACKERMLNKVKRGSYEPRIDRKEKFPTTPSPTIEGYSAAKSIFKDMMKEL